MPYRYACHQLEDDRGTSTGQRVSLQILHHPSYHHLSPIIRIPGIYLIRLSASVLIDSTIWSFKRGATLLLRDSLPPPTPTPTQSTPFDPSSPIIPESDHLTITNHRQQVYERVGPYIFQFAAGSFFQNNNSILIPLTEYVKQAISTTLPKPTHLVDTYCGSGLFGITLSDQFEKVAGVEISSDSIKAAKVNAEMNGLGEKTEWLCGKAEDIFGGLAEKGFEGGKSCVVVDVSHFTIPLYRIPLLLSIVSQEPYGHLVHASHNPIMPLRSVLNHLNLLPHIILHLHLPRRYHTSILPALSHLHMLGAIAPLHSRYRTY